MASYNTFGRNGTTITDPRYLFRLEGCEDIYGDFSAQYTPQEVTEWLVMQNYGIPAYDVTAYCRESDPVLIFRTVGTGKEQRCPYNETEESNHV